MPTQQNLSLPTTKLVITTILVLLTTLTGFMAMDVFSPSLPAIAQGFSVSSGIAQLTIAIYLCGFGLSQLFYGPLSDYYGRRPVLLIGFTIFLLGSCLCIIAPSITMLLIGRLVQGIGIGAGAALSRVILRDLFVSNKMAQVASYLTAVIAITTAFSPAMGGIIQQFYGYEGNLWLMLLFGGSVLILLFYYLPETNLHLIDNSLKISSILKSYAQVLRNKIFIVNVSCAGMGLSSLLTYTTINPFLLQNGFGFTPVIYGLLTMLIALGELVGTMINAWLVNQCGAKKMLMIGFIILFIAGSCLVFIRILNSTSLVLIITFNFLANIGVAFILPNTAAEAFSAFNEKIGFVGALYGFQQILVTALTIYLVSFFQIESQVGLGYIFIVLAVLGFCSYSALLFKSNSTSSFSTNIMTD